MKISFASKPPVVLFRLDEVDPQLDAALEAAFWQRIDGDWQRDYPADAPLLDRVMLTFSAYGERMIRQMGGLDPIPWERALEAWADRAQAAGITWWLTGSGATALRVPAVTPHDLDVMVDPAQIDLVRQTFADALIDPLLDTGGWVVRSFGVLFLHARIDIASDPLPSVDDPVPSDFGPYAASHLETVVWRGHIIRVPPLSLQAEVNHRRGRIARAKQIERVIGPG